MSDDNFSNLRNKIEKDLNDNGSFDQIVFGHTHNIYNREIIKKIMPKIEMEEKDKRRIEKIFKIFNRILTFIFLIAQYPFCIGLRNAFNIPIPYSIMILIFADAWILTMLNDINFFD